MYNIKKHLFGMISIIRFVCNMQNRMHHIIIASLSVYPVIPWQRQVLWKQDASYNYYFPVCLSVLLFHDRDKYYENRIQNFIIASLSVCLACYTMIKTETNILKTGGIILLPYVRNKTNYDDRIHHIIITFLFMSYCPFYILRLHICCFWLYMVTDAFR